MQILHELDPFTRTSERCFERRENNRKVREPEEQAAETYRYWQSLPVGAGAPPFAM